MRKKPRIFIASSVEGLEVAKKVNEKLEYVSEPTLWTDAFALSSMTLATLIEKAEETEFAVFVFSADDKAYMRNDKKSVVRDNVLFELGLFIGKLGLKNCFIIKPRNADLHIPTDLAGLTIADFDDNRSDGDLTAALTTPCSRIETSINKVQDVASKKVHTSKTNLMNSDIKLIQEFKEILPSSGIMKFIKNNDFGGAFLQSKINPLHFFARSWNDAEHEFLDDGLEEKRIHLLEKCNIFLSEIALKTEPHHHNPDLQTVRPRNFDHSEIMQKKLDNEIRDIHISAEALYKVHQEFIRLSNHKLS